MFERRVFLVVEPLAVIAEDLAECIAECHTDARVLRAANAGAAMAAVTGAGRITAAFVHLDPAGFQATSLGMALAERGAAVIYMGSRADAAPEGTLLRLHSPFDTDTVMRALEPLCERCGTSQAPSVTPGA